jgi:NAD+ synthase (glutamine-hydrolysing)
MSHLRVAAVSLSQTPLDWSRNFKNMQDAIDRATKSGAKLIVLPELAVTGYGCEDAFLMQGVDYAAIESILNLKVDQGVFVVVGTPINILGRLYNGAALLSRVGDITCINGIYLKQNLAKNGIHYENRWFNAWPKGQQSTVEFGELSIPVGDIVFDVGGVRIGFEICEDAWVAERPGLDLFNRGVDIIVNPSASHFAIGKYVVREQFVKEGSRAFGAAYIYANLNGCESGRAIFDGGNLIASGGKIVAKGDRMFMAKINITLADIDLWENKLTHQVSSQAAHHEKNTNIIKIRDKLSETDSTIAINRKQTQAWQENNAHIAHEEAIRAVALGLYGWLEKTNTNGFTLSLSGGADSALVATSVYLMVTYALYEINDSKQSKGLAVPPLLRQFAPDHLSQDIGHAAKEITSNLLTTVYQSTINSGEVTKAAAKAVSEGIGATFYHWSIDDAVNSYSKLVETALNEKLTWDKNDIALQNIQARSRAPGVWMMANVKNQLLLTTGNLSESAVGYMTQDGDTAGVLAPIVGIRKTRVRELLSWLQNTGTKISDDSFLTMDFLDCINNQQPTAELRPNAQTDEEDLMPFPILDSIITESLVLRRNPQGILKSLVKNFPDFNKEVLAIYLVKYYRLFSRNQWKRDRSAPGFHIEMDSLDPKTFARFPLLNSGFESELNEIKEAFSI